MQTYQRKGSSSNSQVGLEFELRAKKVLADHGIKLSRNHQVLCGLNEILKSHTFDLGTECPNKIIVECKTHTWTASGNVPSAKMKNWAEAMFYFHMAPSDYRKIFIVERSVRRDRKESLLRYFLRTQAHMIPTDVEFWELDNESDEVTFVKVKSQE